MQGLVYRVFLTVINIFFPPLAVMMLCGASWDCMLNCIFFLLAVIPSHVHGFYISCTYFHRRRKVKKGRYPGGAKSMIHSQNVLNGGASNAEVDRLWRKENGLETKMSDRSKSRSRPSGMTRTGSRRDEMLERQNCNLMQRQENNFNGIGSRNWVNRPDSENPRWAEFVEQDGYGPPTRLQSSRSRGQGAGYSPVSRTGLRLQRRDSRK